MLARVPSSSAVANTPAPVRGRMTSMTNSHIPRPRATSALVDQRRPPRRRPQSRRYAQEVAPAASVPSSQYRASWIDLLLAEPAPTIARAVYPTHKHSAAVIGVDPLADLSRVVMVA